MDKLSKLFKHFNKDIPASIVVFLVALPLCLGIALASGAPLISGMIAGIIGGIVVGALSGSHLSVTGPAAGLTVIVLGAIADLGGFQFFLVAVVLAGIIQIIMGVLNAGIVGLYFPSSVIKGMLAAIGLILIMKQIPHFLGFDEDAFGEMSFLGTDGRNTFEEIIYSLEHINTGALIVGVLSFLVLVIWEQPFIKGNKVLKMIPGGLIAVAIGLIANVVFSQTAPQFYIGSEHLVSLPAVDNLDSLASLIVFPDFSALMNPKVYVVAGTLAIIASLETLLSIEAVDKLDPEKRRTPQNKELFAQGIGNTISGLIGGLPMTAVIVRSSANLDAGAKTKMSAIIHGFFLLFAVLIFAPFLNQIPLAALASILLVVGYKLSKPGLYFGQYKLGKEQFIPFIVTVVAILFTDLLVGILIGMSVGVYYILRANYRVSHFYNEEEHEEGGILKINIKLSEHVSFLNKASLLLALEELPENSHVIIDGTHTKAIDYDVLEILYNFKETAKGKGIKLFLKNIPKFNSVNLH